MANAFDPRLMEVDIKIGNETLSFNQDFFITAQGTKWGNENQNQCEVRIENLTTVHRNQILTAATRFRSVEGPNAPLPTLTLKAGRQSYGLAQLFVGDITKAIVTQPPDIGIVFTAITNMTQRTQNVAINLGAQTTLSTIAQTFAKQLGLSLAFYATDRPYTNFSFTGSLMDFQSLMQNSWNVHVFVDDSSLVVLDQGQSLPEVVKEVNMNTGMVGIPELTDQGYQVKIMYDNATKLYQKINLTSKLNPASNGHYVIYNLHHDLASRDQPFYLILECGRLLN